MEFTREGKIEEVLNILIEQRRFLRESEKTENIPHWILRKIKDRLRVILTRFTEAPISRFSSLSIVVEDAYD